MFVNFKNTTMGGSLTPLHPDFIHDMNGEGIHPLHALITF